MVSSTVIQKYVNLEGIIVVSPTVIQKYVNLGGIIVVSPTVIPYFHNQVNEHYVERCINVLVMVKYKINGTIQKSYIGIN